LAHISSYYYIYLQTVKSLSASFNVNSTMWGHSDELS